MRIRKFIMVSMLFICVIIYGYSAIDTKRGQIFSICVDAGSPLSVVWPCEVAIVGDNGEKGLRIGPKIGRGWRGEAGGEATYKFYIPHEGKYYIWAYCLWFDECANAIFARIDDMDKAILGNDPIYKQWHWTRGFDVNLKKGTHTMVLSNHSDHIALQKVLFISSSSAGPENSGPVFSDIFYDGFDGCAQGNFASWKIIYGEWVVQNPEQTCLVENVLIGKSVDTSFIIYNSDSWSDYSLDIEVKSAISESSEGSVGICFGVKGPDRYHQLKIQPVADTGSAMIEISSREYEEVKVLSKYEIPWRNSEWHHVQVNLDGRNIIAGVDNAKLRNTPTGYEIAGGIGLLLNGKITALFDNVHIRQHGNVESQRL